MSLQTQHRGFIIGREVGGCGRCTRLVLGLLAGGLLLTTILYIVLFWLLGERVRHPWLRTILFWLPAVFIPFLFLIPWGWGFGALLYLLVSLLVAAFSSYGGCEVVAFPGVLLRRHATVYCPLNAIDLVECRRTYR